jgi:hypothetical protein
MRVASSEFASSRHGASLAFARHRKILALAIAAAAAAMVAPASASAQSPPSRPDSAKISIDSLATRLQRAEAELELLKQRLATEASSNIRTHSRIQAEVSARILLNAFTSSGALNSADVPTFATNDSAPNGLSASARTRTAGLSLRQSRVGLSVFVDSVLGGSFDSDVEVDFFGGGSAEAGDEYVFPQPRLRTAHFIQHWRRSELMFGAEAPLISDLSPVTVASVGEPEFSDAGNLWNWLPQIRLTRELGSTPVGSTALRWAIQGAVLQPFTGITLAGDESGIDAGQRSGRPYLESRFRAQWGPNDGSEEGGEIGIGVHRGWIRLAGNTLTTSHAISADARLAFPRHLDLLGEAYRGRALEGLGGGGIDQNFGIAAPGDAFGAPLRDVGGWAQLNWRAHSTFLTGIGCGIDAPDARDNPDRRRNQTCAVHALWRPAQPLLFGVEVRNLRTTYASRVVSGTHLNFSFGFEL